MSVLASTNEGNGAVVNYDDEDDDERLEKQCSETDDVCIFIESLDSIFADNATSDEGARALVRGTSTHGAMIDPRRITGPREVHLMKVDIQGSECNMLAGFSTSTRLKGLSVQWLKIKVKEDMLENQNRMVGHFPRLMSEEKPREDSSNLLLFQGTCTAHTRFTKGELPQPGSNYTELPSPCVCAAATPSTT
ncbi:unnamed protein product [Amoebophrya sp. A25]|nr:unnamed protein product [Amoebophrya sp. A25]|eukprot:GSA25T00005039001.1